MGIERIPVLLWKEPTGLFTAALVEDEQNNAAFGQSADEALSALQDWLIWTQKNEDWNFPHSELKNPRLAWSTCWFGPSIASARGVFPATSR